MIRIAETAVLKQLNLISSEHSHVHHVAPSLVVSVRSVWVLVVVGSFHGKLGIIGVMGHEFDLTLQGREVLAMDLVGEMPEHTLPNEVSLTVFEAH